MRTFLRGKITLLFMTCAVLLAIPAIVLADNVQNDVVATAGQKIVSVQAGQTTGNVGYQIAETGGDSTDTTGSTGQKCNPAVTPAKLTLSGLPTGVTVKDTSNNTLTAPHLTFTTCGTYQYVKFAVGSSVAAGDYAISVSDITNNGFLSTDFNETPADFTLRVTTAPPSDTTAPVIGYTLNPAAPDGSNGWYKSNVSLTWSVTDPESAVTKTGCVNQNITADQAETTYSCSATSAGGSAGPVNVSIKRDATPPTIEGSASPAPNANGWNNEDVTVSYLCDDNLSGVASCGPDETLSSNGADQSSTGTAVDNASNSATDTVSNIDIDKALPSVTVNGFNDGAVFTTSNTLPTVSCTVSDGLSGPVDASPTPSVDDDRVNGVGSVTYTCEGADNADNTNSASKTLRVIHDFAGFFAPVDNPSTGKMNSLKAGSAIPLKFSLDGAPVAGSNTGQGLNVLTSQGSGQLVSATKISCSTGELLDPVPTTELVSASSTNLTYDGVADHYNLVWKTDKAWAGQCRQAVIVTNDGEPHKANFYFTK